MGTVNLGLFYFQNGRFVRDTELPDYLIKNIYVTSRGVLWVSGAKHGLFFRDQNKWKQLPAVPKTSTYSFVEFPDGTLWITSAVEGLIRIRGQDVARVTPAQGLCSQNNFDLLTDGIDRVWTSGTSGICEISLRQLNAVADGKAARLTARTFGLSEGLRHPEANGGISPPICRTRDGRFWVPTEGVAMIDPEDAAGVDRSVGPPQPILELAEYAPGRDWPNILPLGKRDVSFRFSLPYFRGGGQANVQFRLSGYDQQWLDGRQRREVRYTNLPPAITGLKSVRQSLTKIRRVPPSPS